MSKRSRLPENTAAMDISFSIEEMNLLNDTFAVGTILGSTYLQR